MYIKILIIITIYILMNDLIDVYSWRSERRYAERGEHIIICIE